MLSFLILVAVLFPFFCLTLWALIDIIVKRFSSTKEKAIWFVIASFPVIGSVFYLLFGRRRGKKD